MLRVTSSSNTILVVDVRSKVGIDNIKNAIGILGKKVTVIQLDDYKGRLLSSALASIFHDVLLEVSDSSPRFNVSMEI